MSTQFGIQRVVECPECGYDGFNTSRGIFR